MYLNGVYLGQSSDWTQSSQYSEALQSGANVLAIKGTDLGGVAGFIASMAWGNNTAVSDTSWKVSTTAPVGWEQPGFDDSGWNMATSYGSYGVAPWHQNISGFPTGTGAQWIWSSDNQADNLVYFRYTFLVQ